MAVPPLPTAEPPLGGVPPAVAEPAVPPLAGLTGPAPGVVSKPQPKSSSAAKQIRVQSRRIDLTCRRDPRRISESLLRVIWRAGLCCRTVRMRCRRTCREKAPLDQGAAGQAGGVSVAACSRQGMPALLDEDLPECFMHVAACMGTTGQLTREINNVLRELVGARDEARVRAHLLSMDARRRLSDIE